MTSEVTPLHPNPNPVVADIERHVRELDENFYSLLGEFARYADSNANVAEATGRTEEYEVHRTLADRLNAMQERDRG